jgi:hypothetical protein
MCHPPLRLPLYKVVEYNVAGICVDGLDLPPLTEEQCFRVRRLLQITLVLTEPINSETNVREVVWSAGGKSTHKC